MYAYLAMMQTILQGKQIPILRGYSDGCTMGKLYNAVGVMLLRKIPRLATLSYAEYGVLGDQTKKCPSWIPDYRIAKGEPFVSIRMACQTFDCWPEEFGNAGFKICGSMLETRGVLIDEIDEIDEISIPPEEAINKHHAIPLIKLAAKMYTPYWPTRQDPARYSGAL